MNVPFVDLTRGVEACRGEIESAIGEVPEILEAISGWILVRVK